MSIGTLLVIVLVVLLVSGGITNVNGGPFFGTGHFGGISIGTVLVVLLILVLSGRL